mgnify:FL=1|tara:strand:- start:138 stop:758 length:621 start_codon:yes stop_codon:yes gene_type:complete
MFTGIIERVGIVDKLEKKSKSGRLTISVNPSFNRQIEIGESIAVNGTCLTVAEINSDRFVFDVLSETFKCTSLAELEKGSRVNLELALHLGAPLGGHMVSGHIDETGNVTSIEKIGRDWKFSFSLSSKLLPLIVVKGSIAIDGTSLTVAEVTDDGFSVYIIPRTFSETIFCDYKVGNQVNLEADLIGKYVHRIMDLDGKSVYRTEG